MKFYLSGLGNQYPNLELIKSAIIEADGLGFDGALMPDHYMWGEMRGGHRMPNAYSTLETWVTLTYLAGKTEEISLGTLVTPLPFRHPGMLAKMLSTLDVLSGGRVVLGVGAGWSQVELEGYSEWGGPKYRVDKAVEALKLMIRLWTEDEVTFKGRFYEAKGAVLDPKPVQKPYPRLLFGSTGDRMLRLTGRYADICFIPPWASHQREEIRSKVLEAAAGANRAGEIAFMVGDMGARGPYDSEEYAKKIDAAVESGASYYNTAFPRESLIESMRRFAEDVMPSYK
ncbi:LLM class flavin-dependent oxidoreductase [Candidatus Bathyarchaeota archaeon]|nr:MAG: LLM class flavin-dependent oxidoreductase [Candidatus Bathyarchaeota archaeon]